MAVPVKLDSQARHDEPWVLERPRRHLTSRIRHAIDRLLERFGSSWRSHREERKWE